MVSNCGICGQFAGQAAEKTVRFRGLDKRDGIEKVETGSTDVFIGECCGLDVIESDGSPRVDLTYQSYLNGAADGEIRYVMLIEESVPSTEIEIIESVSMFDESTATVEVDGVAERPVLGGTLPDTVKDHFIGKIE